MSNNSLKSVEDMAEYFNKKLNKPVTTIDSWHDASKFIDDMHDKIMKYTRGTSKTLQGTKSNMIIIDDVDEDEVYRTELIFSCIRNPAIKLEIGYDRDGDLFMYFDSNFHSIIATFPPNNIHKVNEFFRGKREKILLCDLDYKGRLLIESTNNGVFKFSSTGTKPLFMNSRDMATLSIFFENCLIDKLLDI